MKDKSPNPGISFFPSGQGRLPDEPYNTVLFSDCRVENIYWDRNKLFIEYSKLQNKHPDKIRAELKMNPPARATLIEINP